MDDSTQIIPDDLIFAEFVREVDRIGPQHFVLQHWIESHPHMEDRFRRLLAILSTPAELRLVASTGAGEDAEISQAGVETHSAVNNVEADTVLPHFLPETASHSKCSEFGAYRLVRMLGKGGMGIVYQAYHTHLDRTVAVKMIRSGEFASDEEIARFHSEAESAAQLDHPNIVPIYEIGQQHGLHYFTMAYVAGISLDQMLRDRPLPPQKAVEIVRAVAEAISYAHERGVVHRDIKPSNILLDIDGRPRVTDFGLAKRADIDTGLTASGVPVGTPPYMSPEQASGAKVGASSDIYSLGALLYCLLTGRPPFQAASTLDVLRQVKEVEAMPLRRLDRSLPRDLETICAKCLQKRIQARYQSAAEMAEDLSRWSNNLPIRARRVGRFERASRWVQRNPVIAALAILVSVATLLGLAGTTWQWNRAHDNFRRAEAARKELETQLANVEREKDRADLNLMRAESVVEDFFISFSGFLEPASGMQPLQTELLQRGKEYYRWLLSDNETPRLEHRVASAHLGLGRILRMTGDHTAAGNEFQAALEILGKLEAQDAKFAIDGATAQHHLALVHLAEGRTPLAEEMFLAAARVFEAHHSTQSSDRRVVSGLAQCYGNLGNLYFDSRRLEEAEAMLGKSIPLWESLSADSPEYLPNKADLALDYMMLGIVHEKQGRQTLGKQTLHKALALYQTVAARYRTPEVLSNLASCYMNLSLMTQEHHEAVQAIEKSVELREELVRVNPKNSQFREYLAVAYYNYVRLMGEADASSKAQPILQKAIAESEAIVEQHPKVSSYRHTLAINHAQLGSTLSKRDPASAVSSYTRALQLLEDVIRQDPVVFQFRSSYCSAAVKLAELYKQSGNLSNAVATLQEAVRLVEQNLDADTARSQHGDTLVSIYTSLANALLDVGEAPLAHRMATSATSLAAELLQETPESLARQRSLANAQNIEGSYHLIAGQSWQAQRLFEDAIAVWSVLLQRDPGDRTAQRGLVQCNINLAAAVARESGRLSESIGILQSARDTCLRFLDGSRDPNLEDNLATLYVNLGELFINVKEYDNADMVLAEATAILAELIETQGRNSDYVRSLLAAYTNHGIAHRHLHKLPEAASKYSQAAELCEELLLQSPMDIETKVMLAGNYVNLGLVLSDQFRFEESLARCEQAEQWLGSVLRDSPSHVKAQLFMRNARFAKMRNWNALAWIMATSTDDRQRDGEQALEYATLACNETDWKYSLFLDTYAAAMAETGNFEEARKWQEKAITLAPESLQTDFRTHLASYLREEPLRAPPPLTEP